MNIIERNFASSTGRTATTSVLAKSKHVQTTVNAVRNGTAKHTFVFDEPLGLGGKDEGPTPLEGLLGSYCGCLIATAEFIAKKSSFVMGTVIIEAKGYYDPSMYRSPTFEGPSTHYHTVELKGTIETPESLEKLQDIFQKAEKMCPISNLFHAAKVNIKAEWKKA